jgi:adenylate cyclase
MSQPSLSQLIPVTTRLKLHLLVLVMLVFLVVYSKLVCPFIDSLAFERLITGLSLVMLVHLLIRELLFIRIILPEKNMSPARFGFYLSIASWIAAGIVAVIIHYFMYPDFPWSSHLKLMTGYWGLGAGLLAQLEYVILEHILRKHSQFNGESRSEGLAWRLLESFTLFTVIPSLAMVLLVFRYVYEKLIIPGVAWEIIFLSLFFVLVALTVAWLWGQTLREDTGHIVEGLHEISTGHFDFKLDTHRPDELGLVANSINDMATGLVQRERMQDAFGRFVSPEVAKTFIREHVQNGKTVKMGGQRCQVTILMCDLRNFTPLAESMEPEQLTQVLNAYFSEMVQAITHHHGMVDKFIGDAVMAIFGFADRKEESALDAINAAVEMRQRLAEFNRQYEASGWPVLDNGIGLHTGEVVAGYIGSVDRLEFTFIGRAVNLAARIEAQAKMPNSPVLFSEATAQRLSSHLKVRHVNSTQLKGVEHSVDLFTLDSGFD